MTADTCNALTVEEASCPPALYVKLGDVDTSALERTATGSYCPYHGEAGYYSIPLGGEKAVDAVWEYQDP